LKVSFILYKDLHKPIYFFQACIILFLLEYLHNYNSLMQETLKMVYKLLVNFTSKTYLNFYFFSTQYFNYSIYNYFALEIIHQEILNN